MAQQETASAFVLELVDAGLDQWDPATQLSVNVDADVAAIAHWAAAHETATATPAMIGIEIDQSMDKTDDAHGPASSNTDTNTSDTSETLSRRHSYKRHKTAPAPPVRRIRKPRKSTYVTQKEEKYALSEEIRLLETRLEQLQVRAGLPTSEDKRAVAKVQEANFEIEESIHLNLLEIGEVHSLLSRHMHSIVIGPMSTHIHLPAVRAERHATLRAMRAMKLRRAEEMLLNRMQHVDNTKPYVTEERYITDDGAYVCKQYELLPFPDAWDVKHVFDRLLSVLHANTDSVMNWRLPRRAPLSIRDELDLVEPSMWHRRLVSQINEGNEAHRRYEEEMHTINFAQFYGGGVDDTTESFGIVAVDSVDVDDLYPYQSNERIRQDVTAAIRTYPPGRDSRDQRPGRTGHPRSQSAGHRRET